MMFIIRSGIQILCDQPRLYFSRNSTPGKDEWLRIAKPVPNDPLWTANDTKPSEPRGPGRSQWDNAQRFRRTHTSAMFTQVHLYKLWEV